MLKKIISLILLLSINLLSQNMQELPEPNDEEIEINSRLELNILKKIFSLKRLATLAVIKLINNGYIDQEDLKKVPFELISYLNIYKQIESLNPENPNKCQLPEGLQANFQFLKSLYLIDENSGLLNNLDLLISGLQKIDLTKQCIVQTRVAVILHDKTVINPIIMLSKIINTRFMGEYRQQTNSDENNAEAKILPEENSDSELQKLTQYCVKFDNLSLIIFLNLIHEIPLETNFELASSNSSMIDLACITKEDNHRTIDFLVKEATRRSVDWKKITSGHSILLGILSPSKEKRAYLITLGKELKVNSNQYIGFPAEKSTPIILAVVLGYDDAFEFYLERFISAPDGAVHQAAMYNEISNEFNHITSLDPNSELEQFFRNELKILSLLRAHLRNKNSAYIKKLKRKIKNFKIKLNNMLKKIN